MFISIIKVLSFCSFLLRMVSFCYFFQRMVRNEKEKVKKEEEEQKKTNNRSQFGSWLTRLSRWFQLVFGVKAEADKCCGPCGVLGRPRVILLYFQTAAATAAAAATARGHNKAASSNFNVPVYHTSILQSSVYALYELSFLNAQQNILKNWKRGKRVTFYHWRHSIISSV